MKQGTKALRCYFYHLYYQVTMSYFELYNEMIRDLLNPSSGLLDLREDNRGRNVVAGLSEVEAASTEDIMAMLVQGNTERTQEPTAANLTSSRCEICVVD